MNGWDNSIDNNRSKSVGGQVAIAPVAGLHMFASYIYGPERNDNNSDNRSVVDLAGSYAISPFFTFGISGDYGTEQRATPDGTTAQWNGAAMYFRFDASKFFALTLRGEHFEDHGGARTGVDQKLREVTLTPEFHLSGGLVVRGDFRLDISNHNVFEKAGSFTNKQFTICANVLFTY